MTLRLIDANRDEFGLARFADNTMQLAPPRFYAAKSRPPSTQAAGDAAFKVVLVALWRPNCEVNGVLH